MAQIRTHMAEYSKGHPEMPISYAAGYALSDDFPECTMRELFRYADKNMYIDKNRAKMEEAIKEKQINLSVLRFIKEKGFSFTDCVYCDGQQDQYRVLRASSSFFLCGRWKLFRSGGTDCAGAFDSGDEEETLGGASALISEKDALQNA